jgi:hypothetical protein
VHGSSVLLFLVIAAIHQAEVSSAVCHAEDVAGFMGSCADGPPQAQSEIGLRITVSVN